MALAGEASTGEPRARPEGTATAITAEETAASTEVVAETAVAGRLGRTPCGDGAGVD